MSQEFLSSPLPSTAQELTQEATIPLLEEQLVVGKRDVQTGIVRLRKRTEERTETIEVPLTQTAWEVERVPINQVVRERPENRIEGETTVYPVVEERVTIVRELVLVEEIRVTRSVTTKTEVSSHTLRREHISAEREGIAPATGL